jgi:hypothetical protein
LEHAQLITNRPETRVTYGGRAMARGDRRVGPSLTTLLFRESQALDLLMQDAERIEAGTYDELEARANEIAENLRAAFRRGVYD